MWLGVPGHCFDPLISIYEPMAFVLENVEKRQNYPDTLYKRFSLKIYVFAEDVYL